MSIHKKWSHYTNNNASSEPEEYGVYEIGDIDTGAILFIGEGKVRSGLLSHSPDGGRKKHVSVFGSSVVGNYGYRYKITDTKEKAKQLQTKLLADFKKIYGCVPRFNQRQEETTATHIDI